MCEINGPALLLRVVVRSAEHYLNSFATQEMGKPPFYLEDYDGRTFILREGFRGAYSQREAEKERDIAMSWIDDLSTAWERVYPGLDTATFPPMVRLARLSLLIESFQQAVLAPFELSPGDYGVLAALRRAGDPYALSPSKLYSRLQRFNPFLSATQDLLGPLSPTELNDTDHMLQRLLDTIETRRPQ